MIRRRQNNVAALSPVSRATSSVIEQLESRTLMTVAVPYQLEWTGSEVRIGLDDKDGANTGFEQVLAGSNYVQANLDVVGGVLNVTSSGSPTNVGPLDGANSLDNGLVNNFNGSARDFTIQTKMVDLTGVLTASNQQAGLWFGPDQDNYVKLVVSSSPNGARIQFLDERKVGPAYVHTATTAQSYSLLPSGNATQSLEFQLDSVVDAATGNAVLSAFYRADGATAWTKVGPDYVFSGSIADRFYNANSKAGVLAYHRSATVTPAVVSFDSFAIFGAAGIPEAKASTDARTLLFNDTLNGNPSAARTVTITNTGSAPLTLGSVSLGGTGVASYAIVTDNISNTTLASGASATVTVAFDPTGADTTRGLKVATLNVPSNAVNDAGLVVALRGLATTASGEDAEPSLQRVLDLYEIPVRTGDTDPDDAELYDAEEPLDPNNDEVVAARFVKAGAGPVTIEPLAIFGISNVVSARFGTYEPGSPSVKSELLAFDATSRTVNPTFDGSTAFDPGAGAFGLYATASGRRGDIVFKNADAGTRGDFNIDAGGTPRDIYSEKSLNTWDTANPQKFRFYPLKDTAGNAVPNAYVFTLEEYDVEFDSNDVVGIIRNVSIAPDAPEIGIIDPDEGLNPDSLAFNKLQTTVPDPINGQQPPDNKIHDVVTIRITNTGTLPLTISNIATTGVFAIENTDFSQPVAPGSSLPVTVRYTAVGTQAVNNGTLTITSNDPDEPTKVIKLSGLWQTKSEGLNERSAAQVVQALGFGTVIGTPTQLNTAGQPTLVGDEVQTNGYFRSADGGEVVVRQLAAFHTQGQRASFRWFSERGVNGGATAPAPTGLLARPNPNASNRSATGFSLSWTDNATTETGFLVQRRADGGAWSDVATLATDAVAYSDNNLTFGKVYDYRVRAIAGDAGGVDTGFSNVATGQSLLSHDGDWGQSFFPNRNEDATGYQPVNFFQPTGTFGITIDGEFSDDTLNAVGDDDTTTDPHRVRVYPAKTSTGTVIANTYLVIMDYEGINYDYNDNVYIVSNLVPSVGVASPQRATAFAKAGAGISLDWGDNVDPALSGYNVYRSTDGTTFTQVNSAPLTSSDYVDTTAVAGTNYTYRLTALGAVGVESLPTTLATTTATASPTLAPAAPTNVVAVADSSAQVFVTWQPSPGADSYAVEFSTNNGGSWTTVGTPVAGVTELTVDGLNAATPYQVRVTAVNAAGPTVSSNVASVVTDVV